MNKRILAILFIIQIIVCWGMLGSFAATSTSASSGQTASEKAASDAAAKAASDAAAKAASDAARRAAAKVASSSVSSDVSSMMDSEISSAPSSSEFSLPDVGSIADDDLFSSVQNNDGSTKAMNVLGIISWACIGLGVIVVLAVVFSNRKPPRGPGRKRYKRPKRSRKRHLLNDKYYRGINRY